MEKELEHEIYNRAAKTYLNLNKERVQEDAILLQHQLWEAKWIVEKLSHKQLDDKKRKEFIEKIPMKLKIDFKSELKSKEEDDKSKE